MRKRARHDRNQSEIVTILRAHGISVLDTSFLGGGAPDIVTGFRGENRMCEIKDELQHMSDRKLTQMQIEFHARWKGKIEVITSPVQALRIHGINP